MAKNVYIFLLLCCATTAWNQPLAEPLKSKYLQAKTSRQKAEVVFDTERPSAADSVSVVKMMALRDWFKKNHDDLGANYAQLYLATVFTFKGEGDISLKMIFPLLKQFERENDRYGMMRCYHAIGMAYSVSKSNDIAFTYLKKAIALAKENNYEKFLSIVYNGTGVAYNEAGNPEQGLIYAQQALQLDTKYNDLERLPVSLSTVGENLMSVKSFDLAIPFLRKSFHLIKKGQQNTYSDVYIHNDLAHAFLGLKQFDSAVYYADRAIRKSMVLNYREERLHSYQYLIEIFKLTKRQDSLNKYYPLLIKMKDELYGIEKLRSVEASNFAEQLRQREIEDEKNKAASERQQNIQYAFIATGIITFFIFFLLLSRSIIANEKWISFLATLALLLVFEFINLLIHPFLEKVTHHAPVLMLLCLVALASLLIPLHHRLEHFIKHRLTEKNKAIRLAAAKKTIETIG